ncbi:hypothetical protein [Paracidovorax wautersii]|uniref:Uncharacterized protein n=1 Tax=Paracidovorax wautersii TaxID=1177982 RepID=A0ABU1IC14_9BURK|nr:hypothetical protein [Paracidovorax wautersii]MDR6214103.1 hypothetical protein [Paracidovorax wautersii]
MLLDTGLHQGSSLHSFMPQADLRVLAILSRPGTPLGLETLWQVCASLQRLGYPVAVLDGTAEETEDAPGLEHLLAAPSWQGSLCADTGAAGSASLAVIPAAHGLVRLAERSHWNDGSALQRLHPHFRAYALVALYAPPETMAPILRGSATVPLILAAPGAAGVVQSYQQLKHMTLHAGLQCTVASILPPGNARRAAAAEAALQTLQRCSERHLGTPLRTTTVKASNPQDIQRLALQLLENAGTMGAASPMLPASHHTDVPAHFVRSH